MKILVVGCERSGTKMLAAKLGDENQVEFSLENKHTVSSFRYYQELQKWNKYVSAPVPTIHTKDYEKHSLNQEVNIDFLKWVKNTFSEVKMYYIIRDGRNVVSSIINKVWGHSQTVSEYRINLEEACSQWNEVVNKSWDWAQENCEIVRYEDHSTIVSNPLSEEELALATPLLEENLQKTGYL